MNRTIMKMAASTPSPPRRAFFQVAGVVWRKTDIALGTWRRWCRWRRGRSIGWRRVPTAVAFLFDYDRSARAAAARVEEVMGAAARAGDRALR